MGEREFPSKICSCVAQGVIRPPILGAFRIRARTWRL
jgi:hypothetical protein